MIEIEKGIAAPSQVKGESKYPWKRMEIGDSFVFPGDISPSTCLANTSAANRRLDPKQFRTQHVGDGVYRCWRVE